MQHFYLLLLVFSLNAIQALKRSNLKNNVVLLMDVTRADKEDTTISKPMRRFLNKNPKRKEDETAVQNTPSVMKNVRKHGELLNNERDTSSFIDTLDKRIGRHYFHLDPFFNDLNGRRLETRRQDTDYARGSSSEVELKFWMDEFEDEWMHKKLEALNSTQPRGDIVNMAAARPWGVPCGDPNQYDTPWGSCMLPVECEAEFRIYRGDSFCGRTTYICCALQLTNYDMYQGLDISVDGSSFSTDSDEKNAKAGSREIARKKRVAEQKKRKKDKETRMKRITKSIRNIVFEIRKILNRAYRNGTAQRQKKTKELKKFITVMKKQYRKDRKAVLNLHEFEMVKIDENLQDKLNKVRGVNEAFMTNDTYRDIIVNGTVNKGRLMEYLRMHPELGKFVPNRRMGGLDLEIEQQKTEPVPETGELEPEKEEPESEKEEPQPMKEETEPEEEESEPEEKNPKILHYDLEYGMLYF